MKSYQNTLDKRKEYLKSICRSEKSWKLRMFIYYLLIALSMAIIIFTVIMLIRHPLDAMGIFSFICAAVAFSSIPFIISCSIKNTAKYKCAYPYSSFANGVLILYDDKLEYIHWRVGKSEPAAYSSKRAVYLDEDSFVYTIYSSQIKALKIDKKHICHISGKGNISQPKWVGTKGERENVEVKSFSFLLDFEEREIEEILRKWVHL